MATLETESGEVVPALRGRPEQFLCRSTVIYGGSGSGKTVMIKHIMKELRRHVDQAIVVCPTEESNHSYRGIVHPLYIHSRMWRPNPDNPKKRDAVEGRIRFLENIWDRQEMQASVYKRANQPRVLESLYKRLSRATRREGDHYIKACERLQRRAIETFRRRYQDEPERYADKWQQVKDMYDGFVSKIYKRYIVSHSRELWAQQLNEEERHALSYVQLNPHLLVIFDDCASDIGAIKNKEVVKKFFYQNRHVYLTVLGSFQDDSDIGPNLRKNAHISIFADPTVATTFFERGGFSKQEKSRIHEAVRAVYGPEGSHRKLIYIREDPTRQKLYHFRAARAGLFRFGSEYYNELAERLYKGDNNIDQSNPYYKYYAT
jgi:hypothetical protein